MSLETKGHDGNKWMEINGLKFEKDGKNFVIYDNEYGSKYSHVLLSQYSVQDSLQILVPAPVGEDK